MISSLFISHYSISELFKKYTVGLRSFHRKENDLRTAVFKLRSLMIVIERNPPNEEPKRVMIKRIPWILDFVLIKAHLKSNVDF